MASEVVMSISKDLEDRLRLMSEEKAQLDYQSKMVYAKRKALAEDRQEVAHNLKNLGVSIEVIQKATGLSLEKIK